MADLYKYIIIKANNEWGDYEYDSLDEAKEAAEQRDEPVAILERQYVIDDSELVWTSTGDEFWPPRPKMKVESAGSIRNGETVWSATREENS